MTDNKPCPDLHQIIRDAGGIVHSDGNIFFKSAVDFCAAADRAMRAAEPKGRPCKVGGPCVPSATSECACRELPADSAVAQAAPADPLQEMVDLSQELGLYDELRPADMAPHGSAVPIEYRYEGGSGWCELGPAESMKTIEQQKGSRAPKVYRLREGEYPVWRGDPPAAVAGPSAPVSPMAKMALALREKSAAERNDFDRRVQSGEWGAMPEPSTEADALPNHVAEVKGDDAIRILRWSNRVGAFDYPVGTKLYATPTQAAPHPEFLPLLVRDIANDLGASSAEVCKALKALGFGDASVNMAVTPAMAAKLREHFATHPAEGVPAQDDARDAQRYRFLREWANAIDAVYFEDSRGPYLAMHEALDKVIDAAIAQSKETPNDQ